MGANREYKNGLFALLFSDPVCLLLLYNALTGSSLPMDTPVEIATLTDVLFTNRRNDIAFVVGGRMVILIEHQSTINENMPLRLLIYIARVYEKLVDNEAIYKTKLVGLPRPDFVVLYNGRDPFPAEKTMRLSDAFAGLPEGAGAAGLGGLLELAVRVVNINEGCNEHMLQKCGVLGGYSRLVGKIRRHETTESTLAGAITRAVNECIREGVLVDFLKDHASEVVNMLTLQYDAEAEKRVIREEGREEGREQGREEGREQGQADSMRIISALKKNKRPDEIASALRLPVEKVLKWQQLLSEA
jgi:hypothetical protein